MTGGKLLVRGVIGGVIVLVAWVAYASSKQIERNKGIEKEVAALQAEADKIRRENETLSEKISYFSSSSFQEQEAKKKLGLRKADENVAVIQPRTVVEEEKNEEQTTMAGASSAGTRDRDHLPNYRKWWERFFSNEQGKDI